MKPVTVGRYKPENFDALAEQVASGEVSDRWLGWVETEDWIVYEHESGDLYAFNGRRPEGGVRGPLVKIERSTSEEMPPPPVSVLADGRVQA